MPQGQDVPGGRGESEKERVDRQWQELIQAPAAPARVNRDVPVDPTGGIDLGPHRLEQPFSGSVSRPAPVALVGGLPWPVGRPRHPATPLGWTTLAASQGGSVLVQDWLPDLVAAAQLPYGVVLDGEPVVWDTEAGRLTFEALQRRAATRARGTGRPAPGAPRGSPTPPSFAAP